MISKDFEMRVDHLLEFGVAVFDTTITKKECEICMINMKEVVETDEAKNFKFCTDPYEMPGDHDRGLFRRNSKDEKDDKWCGHYRPSLRFEYQNKFKSGEVPHLFEGYLSAAKKIYTKASMDMEVIVHSLNNRLPEFHLFEQFMDIEAQSIHALRSNLYDKPKKTKTVAGGHFDRDFITGCIYESAPGLYFKDKNGDITPYKYAEGSMLVFFGKQAHELTNGILPKVWHGVNVFEPDVQRDSIVFFGKTVYPFYP